MTSSNELDMLRESVHDFTATATTLRRVRELRNTVPGYDRKTWQRMAELGWMGIMVPEEFTGLGLGLSEMRVVSEGLARALVPEPVTASGVLACSLLLHADATDQRAALLRDMAMGNLVIAAACQEGIGGLEFTCCKTRIHSTGSGLALTGSKRFVTPVAADGYVVSAQHDGVLELYWLPADAPGIGTGLEPRADGSFSAIITFNATPVLTTHRIARGEIARVAIERAYDEARLMASAELFGIMARALEITMDYMRTRVQFGKPIGTFQALRHRLVDLWIQKELCDSVLDEALRSFALDDAPADSRARAVAASRAKSRCSDAALMITRECIKLHGAIGIADECDIGLYLQRALVLSAWLGNGAEHRRRYARLADPVPVTVRTTSQAAPESPPDTDWNAMSDEDFRHELRSYIEAHYPEQKRYLLRRARWSETREWAQRMSRKGWIAPAWPREHGGMGLSPAKFIIFAEEQERWGVVRAPDQSILMLGPILMRYGTEPQKREYLPKIISTEHVWCQGYSEPNAGSDLANLMTSAELDDDHFVINGSKTWNTLAQDATHMFMLARTDKHAARRQEGISFFIVNLNTPGIRIRPIRHIDGHEEFCEVFLDNVRIPKHNLVGELNQGWTVAKALLGLERLNSGSPRRAQYPLLKIAAMARARGVWADAEFQSKYVQLRLDVADLGAAFTRFADVVRNGGNPGPEISFLKVWSSETLQRLAELTIEMAGEEGGIHAILKFDEEKVDVLGPFYQMFGATTASGTNDIQRNILATHVLGLK